MWHFRGLDAPLVELRQQAHYWWAQHTRAVQREALLKTKVAELEQVGAATTGAGKSTGPLVRASALRAPFGDSHGQQRGRTSTAQPGRGTQELLRQWFGVEWGAERQTTWRRFCLGTSLRSRRLPGSIRRNRHERRSIGFHFPVLWSDVYVGGDGPDSRFHRFGAAAEPGPVVSARVRRVGTASARRTSQRDVVPGSHAVHGARRPPHPSWPPTTQRQWAEPAPA